MSTSQPIHVGIAGLGWPGERHAEAIAASHLGKVYAACDLSQERLTAFIETFRPEKTFISFEEMLQDPALHAVVICLPNFLHFAYSLEALRAGKHVLCEKPPTFDASQMETLHREACHRNLVYCFGRQMRFSPAMESARRIISEGRLGRVYFAETMWARSRGTPWGTEGWFTDRSKAGGGAMMDLGIHAIDAAWYLMGTPPPRAVSAQTYQNYPQLVRHGVFDVEDSGYGMIRFENNVTLHFKVSWAASLMDDIPESPKYGRSLLSTTVFGTSGSLKLTDVFKLDAVACSSPLVLFEATDGTPERVNVPINDLRGDALRAY
ncbi:MAG: Gfo/Idh/MocA family oxidoreductase, partial [Verrucomicrobia bacterium]|nr:Gfo/Idh/MocA family oxidoreductase [Verrucomicrobiota bacterium]